MKILVTGGAGFIGSHLCSKLLCDGHEVVILDNLNDYYPRELKERNLRHVGEAGSFEFVYGDICDLDLMDATFDRTRPEAVIHLAARAGVRPSIDQPILYQKTNVEGTTVLLECTRKFSVPRFVFASSSSVYGAANRVPFREDDAVQRPISPYAATKIAGEVLCHAYAHLFPIGVTCLRFFTVYGPRQRPDLAIRKFTESILAGRAITMFGDGRAGRDYTFVEDIVSGIIGTLALDRSYEVFNLGNSSPVLLCDMIATIERVLGRKAEIERMPMQPGDVPTTFADISKAGDLLGYEPKTSFDDGIRKTVEWLLEQKLCHQ